VDRKKMAIFFQDEKRKLKMFKRLIILIFCFNCVLSSYGEITTNKIFRFCEETDKIVKFVYCGRETPLDPIKLKKNISVEPTSEKIMPGDGIKYFKTEKKEGEVTLRIIPNKWDPILSINELNINSYFYTCIRIEAKILSPNQKNVYGRIFWNSNLDSKYSLKDSAAFSAKTGDKFQAITIDLKDNLNYLGQIKNMIIHPLLDIQRVNPEKEGIDVNEYGIEEINEKQALCSRPLEEEIVLYIRSIELIFQERDFFATEFNFEGHNFSGLFLPPLSQLTYSLVVPENDPVLLFKIFSPYWSYGISIDVLLESDKKNVSHSFKQRGFEYKESSKLFELDVGQFAGKKTNLTFSITSFSNKDIVYLKNPLIIEKQKKKTPNIILIVSDALRADHLSSYGYHRLTSPSLQDLAKEGVIFMNNISQAPATKASHASLFTSKLPLEVGIEEINNQGKLDLNALTLAELLRAEGYLTLGLYNNPHINKQNGFSQGFDDYYYYCYGLEKRGWGNVKNSPKIATEEAIQLIREYRDFPVFLFLYYVDPHNPYTPPEETNVFLDPSQYEEPFYYPRPSAIKHFSGIEYGKLSPQDSNINESLYDAEILNMDQQLGFFIDTLKELNLYENTITVFTSDHGEAFGERGGIQGHGKIHYYEQCHVPLIISFPKKIMGRQRYNKISGNIDIVPTLLTLIGKQYSSQAFWGVPLFAEDGSLNHYDGRDLFVETSNVKGIHSVYTDNFLLIYNIRNHKGSLFDYKTDKENTVNLKEDFVETYNRLENKILTKLEKREK